MATSLESSYKTKLRQLPVLQSANTDSSLSLSTLPSTPQALFATWLDAAIAGSVLEPHAMVLSTVDASGYPDARVLILKNLDARGWHFAIKADSPKGRQLARSPKAALTFYWPELARQVRVRGDAHRLSAEECQADFDERPLPARAGAIASKQSEVLSDPEELAKRVKEVEDSMKMAEGEVPAPEWVVFAVAPAKVEFWQGSKDRLHQRVRYSSADGSGWMKDLLWP